MTAIVALAGHAISCEARMIRNGVFGGIVHVHRTADGKSCEPPVAIIVPGQWQTAEEASQGALDYAALMAGDGALVAAVILRENAMRESSATMAHEA